VRLSKRNILLILATRLTHRSTSLGGHVFLLQRLFGS
jgi:hypothetical protein